MAHAFFEDTQEMECVCMSMMARDPSLDCRVLFDDLTRIDSGGPVSRECAARLYREVVRVRLERARAARRGPERPKRAEDSLASEWHAGRAELDSAVASAKQLDALLGTLEAMRIAQDPPAQRGVMETAILPFGWLIQRILSKIRDDGKGPGSPTPPSPLPGARLTPSRRPVKAGPFPRPFAGSER